MKRNNKKMYKAVGLLAVMLSLQPLPSRAEEVNYHISSEELQHSINEYNAILEAKMKAELAYQRKIATMTTQALSKVGCSYVWGAPTNYNKDARQFDCSSFVQHLYGQVGITSLPRTSNIQATIGTEVSLAEAKEGDLFFYHTNNSRGANGITHVAYYLGNNKIVHARSKRHGVEVTDLNNYNARLVCIRRILE